MSEMPSEARIIAEICGLADKPFVEAVESSFAGHFNELGVVVKLRPGAPDAELVALQNDLLAYFNAQQAWAPAAFTWLVSFSCEGRNLRSLFPGDEPRTGAADLVERVTL